MGWQAEEAGSQQRSKEAVEQLHEHQSNYAGHVSTFADCAADAASQEAPTR